MPPEDAEVNGLQGLYRRRFDEKERERKNALWKVLCEHFLQRYVDPSDTVFDLGAGYGEFINNIRCAHKYAVDLNDDTAGALDEDVTFLKSSASELTDVGDGTADVVFASNLFEHIRSKEELLTLLKEIARVLRVGGKLLVLQPNIRYAFREYWDFFDHHLPLSHHSLREALEMTGYRVTEERPRVLPYTTKTSLPQQQWLLRVYLWLRPLQWLLGRQMFVVAEREG